MSFRNLEDIIAWQEARKLVQRTYSITGQGNFARDFGLRDQIQRASVSIVANIAEGFGSATNAEFSRFLSYSRRSAFEVVSLLNAANDVGYIKQEDFQDLKECTLKIIRIISGLRAFLKKTPRK